MRQGAEEGLQVDRVGGQDCACCQSFLGVKSVGTLNKVGGHPGDTVPEFLLQARKGVISHPFLALEILKRCF